MSTDRVIGIDISGKCLDIHILPEGMAKQYANDVMGICEVVELAKPQSTEDIDMVRMVVR